MINAPKVIRLVHVSMDFALRLLLAVHCIFHLKGMAVSLLVAQSLGEVCQFHDPDVVQTE